MAEARTGNESSVVFTGGTLLVEGRAGIGPGVIWDDRAGKRRAPAYLFGEIAARADAEGERLAGDLRHLWPPTPRSWDRLALRSYQEAALSAWMAAGRRGIVALPTGAGKTRVALAAILACGVPAVVLCPTRALMAAWASELGATLGERIGLVGDGERTIERVTVMTFESAYRRLDGVGIASVFSSSTRSTTSRAARAPRRSRHAPRLHGSGSRRRRPLQERRAPCGSRSSSAPS